ncbi:hypothetical protein SY83_16595 [Paenibacillus swuensis]|uniref:Glycosyl-4,4'-diaponeurosporenoate acyltransferase n=2 Tax=Paenibacillus swuensis TaxID=1178515 RepID=A0A172TPT1_9BACL|nr:hypothetical protein SY83_16595 [Paenibacillus swuensis]
MGTAYACTRIPVAYFERSRLFTRVYSFEQNGLWYERYLLVKMWKSKLPDGSRLFRDGFAKKEMRGNHKDYFRRFVIETRRGELAHFLAMLPAPVFFLWSDSVTGMIMIFYAIVINLPCIVAQRYNRIRFNRLVKLRMEK